MKKNLITVSLVFLTLIALCSCIINIEPGPYDPQPETKEFGYSSVFNGPVKDDDDHVTSYQFMCYVNNKTGRTLENVKFEIDWKDQLGNLVMYDTVTIPRLERGAKWPVGVIHDKEYEKTKLAGSTASIRNLSYSSDFSKYTTDIDIFKTYVTHNADSPTLVTGEARNLNRYTDIKNPKIYIVSEDVHGIIVEFGCTDDKGILVYGVNYHFSKELNPPAGTPYKDRTYFFAVGTRD